MLLIPSISILFSLYFLFYPISNADIPLGSSLTPSNPNKSWTSPNKTFSLTFIPVHSTKAVSYLAAITFDGIPVWKAGGDAGLVDSSASFQLLLNGNLRLINGSGYITWESGTANRGVTTATLDDSGDLSLKLGLITIWSSFNNPTDTILPNQNFTISKSLQSGPYSFSLLLSGSLVLRWNKDIIYWSQAVDSTLVGKLSSPSLSLQQKGTLELSDPLFSVPVVMDYSSDYGEDKDVLRFLRLDSDGNLRIYTSVRGHGTYRERWAAVLDQCRVYGWCGNMGICSYNKSRPICSCPSHKFEFSDSNDSRKGCKRKVEIEDCPDSPTMWQMDHTQFLTYPPELHPQVLVFGSSGCRDYCLSNPSCVASTFLADGTGQCYLKLKASGFLSAYRSPTLRSTSYVKVCAPSRVSYTEIPLGSTLTPSDPNSNWSSPNNTFSVAFIHVPSANGSSFSAAISFYGVPVWKAGGVSGLVDSSGRLELLKGNLRLIDGAGNIIWESATDDKGVTTATLDDSGNLSLKNGRITVWSSFENPTDTILPNQNFTTTMSLQSGPYSFNLLDSGDLVLRWDGVTIYWSQAVNSSMGNLFSASLGFEQIDILQLPGPTFSVLFNMAYGSDSGEDNDVLRFLRLDSDGNLRMYSSVRGSGTATERWVAVLDQCRVYGWCGNMGICSYKNTVPVCGCPSWNFEFLDSNDTRKGCKRKMELKDCPNNATMLQLDHTQFLTYPPELSSQVFFIGSSGCRGNCLTGRSCVASTSLDVGTGQCYLKGSNFVSGYQSLALPSASFVKVCGPALPYPSLSTGTFNQVSGTQKLPSWLMVLISLFGLVLLEVGMWILCCRKGLIYQRLSTENHGVVQHASHAPAQSSSAERQLRSMRCAPIGRVSSELPTKSLSKDFRFKQTQQ